MPDIKQLTQNINNSRLEWVDSLRGLAAIFVFISHLVLFQHTFSPFSSYFIKPVEILDLGKVGVVAFFMISGFVIPGSLEKQSTGRFVINRIFRLYPVYWISILVVIALSPSIFAIKQILINLTMMQRMLGTADIEMVYWTLQVELIFYVICLVLYYFNKLFNERINSIIILLLLSLSMIGSLVRYFVGIKVPVMLSTSLCIMFLGLYFYQVMRNITQYRLSKFHLFLLTFSIAYIPICFFAYIRLTADNEIWWRFALGHISGIFLFMVFQLRSIKSPILLYLGKISYSVYLFHFIISGYLYPKIAGFMNTNNDLVHFLVLAVCMIAVIFFSSITFFLVEEPARSLGHKIAKRI